MRSFVNVSGDWFWRESTDNELLRYGAVASLGTEYEFRSYVDHHEKPSLVVLAKQFPWTKPGPDMPEAPPEVKGDYLNAGLRSMRYLRERHGIIPVVFHFDFEGEPADQIGCGSEEEIYFADLSMPELHEAVRKALRRQ